MIPPIGWVSNAFLASTFSVGHNAVKSLIFKASSLLLQYAVFNFLSYIAYRLSAYTSFLMLLEDFIQKFYFLRSYGFKENAWIVLVFTLLFPAAGLYDTFIWMFDAPGYILRPIIADAQSFSHQRSTNPSYIINIPGSAPGINLDSIVSADLYTGNLTLVPTHLPISQEVVAPLRRLSSDVQPRIWLDNEGWSVGFDLGWPTVLGNQTCIPISTDIHQHWSCNLDSTGAADLSTQSFGSPPIWWDMSMAPVGISPYSQSYARALLGPNVSSGATKQIFVVTKARRRHTLLQTAWKATMQAVPPFQLQRKEVFDFVRRGWDNDPDQVVTPEIRRAVKGVMEAYSRGESYSAGLMVQQPFSMRATVIELLTLGNSTNTADTQFSSLRVRSINTTLLHSASISSSETLQPFGSYPESSTNVVTGSQNTEASGKPVAGSSVDRVDVPVVAILPNIFRGGNSHISENALDPHGQSWMRQNQAHLDELMASRASIVQGDSDGVSLVWQEPIAAISRLQIILVVVPALLALLSRFLMAGNAASYYKHSFFATVCTTTYVSGDDSCRRPEYLERPPRIELKTLRRHVVIGMPNGGTLTNVEHDQVVTYSMVTEPLKLPISLLVQGNYDRYQKKLGFCD